MSELEDNIKSAIGNCDVSSSGYYQLKCPVCNDHTKRAGFKFESDRIIYNCFRGKCDASTEFEYNSGMYKKFRHLMDVFGVDIPIELRLNKKKIKPIEKLDEALYEKHSYDTIEIPSDFVRYNPDYHYYFSDFLESRKAIFPNELFVGKEDPWNNKLIIPFYHQHKLIGWQGISVSSNGKTFYQTSSDNTDIMFINNKQGYINKSPVIVEGIMDAVVIPDAIATLGNTVSRKQAYLLRDSDPILLPDRKGSNFIKIAKRYGWRISIPDWKVKDSNAAVQKYGKFVTMKMIHDGIQTNITKAEVRYNLWAKKK